MARAKREEPDFGLALLTLSEDLSRQSREPNILAYEPHKKQVFFHEADDYLRLYIGGNRSGKSFASVVEGIWFSTGTHPFRNTPRPPLRGRVIGVDLLQGVGQILLPLYRRLCVPSSLKHGTWEKAYSSYTRTLTFANGSTIEFMSYEMADVKFAGTSRHWTHFDEEPPKGVYTESMARLIDTEGDAWISMTPVEGLTWLYDDIYKKVNDDPERIVIHSDPDLGEVYRSPSQETTIIEVSTDENPFLTERGKSRFFGTLNEDDKEARSKGSFVQKSGLVFKNFTMTSHVIPPIANPKTEFKDCTLYTSVDHGWNNPTAWLWHAVYPDGTVVTFGEHYRSEMTIADHAAIVLAKEDEWRIVPEHRTGDPAMKQTSGITGTSVSQEYAKHGIFLQLDSVPRDIATGLARMQQYFKVGTNGLPRWFITEDCPFFIKEMKGLHFKKFVHKKAQYDNNAQEEIQKNNDHTFDSARYFATFLPELAPEIDEQSFVPKLGSGVVDYDKALWEMYIGQHSDSDATTWKTIETY